jgi:hypothetical protein
VLCKGPSSTPDERELHFFRFALIRWSSASLSNGGEGLEIDNHDGILQRREHVTPTRETRSTALLLAGLAGLS